MRQKLVSIGAGLAALSILAGCATRAENITASYTSTVGYSGLSCNQIRGEAQAISQAATAASGAQNSKATKDAVAVGVALVVFWPAVFFVGGDGAQAAEVARLKGEMQAIETASRRKGCGIAFRR